MRVVVVAVGRLKERALRETADDYYGRIRRYAKLEEIELKDGDAAEVGARIARAIPDRSRVVALAVGGEKQTSERFAKWLGRAEVDGVQSVVFVIGGAYGLPPDVEARADLKLSLSTMTLPHRLARILLAEQIYRAFTILRGEPYSH